MSSILSSNALNLYLSDIKHIFEDFDYDRLRKIVFMNADSLFNFIDYNREAGQTGKSFKEIIETIEPFIPLVINDDNLGAYLLTAVSKDESELLRLQEQFIENAKVRFVKNIFTADSDEDLEEIFEICRTIRDYKEKSYFI